MRDCYIVIHIWQRRRKKYDLQWQDSRECDAEMRNEVERWFERIVNENNRKTCPDEEMVEDRASWCDVSNLTFLGGTTWPMGHAGNKDRRKTDQVRWTSVCVRVREIYIYIYRMKGRKEVVRKMAKTRTTRIRNWKVSGKNIIILVPNDWIELLAFLEEA